MVNRTTSKGSPSTPKEAGSKDEKKAAAAAAPTTTSGKKMKQTRLSFAANKEGGGDVLRKRKLSSPDLQHDRTVKVVRREGDPPPADEVVLIDDVEEEEKKNEVIEETKKKEEDVVVVEEVPEDRDNEMIEIIPCEDSNSAAAPTSTADVSLVEEEDEEEEEEEDDPINESINLDNSSCDATGSAASLAFPSEPPTNVNGKPLTPRQLEKWMGKKSRHEERLRQKVERERKLEEERKQREERERLKKKEREDREEAKRKEREEKEAARQREKEEREKKKQLELEQKNEEKRRREEQKDEERRRREEQKEEERRRKEEEKRLKELEEEQKKKRASQAFTKFFKVGPKATPDEDAQQQPDDDVVVVVNQYFMPFAVKGDMKLAPTVRRLLTKEAKGALDAVLKVPSGSVAAPELYLKSLSAKSHVPMKGTKTWTSSDSSDEDSEDELMVVDEEVAHKVEKAQTKQRYRAKYLSFKENRRPAYYGTWQKKSTIVGPRTPFAKDEKTFDYEVESDDEWEEEEPGESLHGSEDEKEKESEDDYEVDNDFFVPHGHLSDEEMQDNEDNEMDDNSPEAQKVKLKLRQDEFNDEMKRKTEKIKPRLIGCIWVNEAGGCPENCPSVFWELLKFRAMLSAGPIVLRPPASPEPEKGDEEADAEDNDTEKVDRRKMLGLAEDECRDLIRLVHGNVNSVKFLVKEFKVHLEKSLDAKAAVPRVITEIGILRKIKEIAVREAFWTVKQEFLDQYNLSDLSLTNAWAYALTPKRTVVAEKRQAQNSPQVTATLAPVPVVDAAPWPKTPVRPPVEKESPPSAKQKTNNNKNSITQFTKVLTNAEKQKQFQSISISSPKPTQTTGAANENKAPKEAAMVVETIQEKPIQPVVASPGAITTTGNAQPAPAKKRVPLLMSVPRGQAISEQSKSLLIKNFLTKQPEEQKGEDLKSAVATATPETIVLD